MNQEEQHPIDLAWQVHPFTADWFRTFLLGIVFGSVLVTVRLSYPEPIWTILAALLLGGSMIRYFFPTRYRLTGEGVEITFLGICHRLSWNKFRSFSLGRTGVLLSPFARPHRLENFRGHYILFGTHREEIVEFVRCHLSPASTSVG